MCYKTKGVHHLGICLGSAFGRQARNQQEWEERMLVISNALQQTIEACASNGIPYKTWEKPVLHQPFIHHAIGAGSKQIVLKHEQDFLPPFKQKFLPHNIHISSRVPLPAALHEKIMALAKQRTALYREKEQKKRVRNRIREKSARSLLTRG